MSNSLIDAYRQQMAAQGAPDDRDDYFVMQDLIPLAQQNPHLLDQYPDFAKEYGAFRDANAPSLGGEFTRALKSGTQEAGATYAGLGALAGIPGAAGEAKDLEADAAENAPTISSLEDISPGETGLAKYASKDTARYLAAKAGGMLPSMAEMVGTGIAGAAVGSAIEPGAGTLAGGVEGALEPVLGRGIIKAAIKSIVEKGVVKDATEEGIADALRAGDQKIADLVTTEAKGIAAGRAEAGVNLANVYGMSAGGIYNETGDRGEALGLGAAAALAAAPPFISLPARVAKTLFPRLTPAAAQAAAEDLVGKKSAELLAKLGRAGEATAVGTGGVVAMEAANIVAKNLSQGKDALDLDDSDWKRLRESAIGGALGAVPFAALAARGPHAPIDIQATPVAADATAAAAAPAEESLAEAPDAQPVAATGPSSLDITRKVAAMTPDEMRQRMDELAQFAPEVRTPAQEAEFQQLQALTPRFPTVEAPAAAAAPAMEAAPTIPPNEPDPDEAAPVTPEPMDTAAVDIGPRDESVSTGTGVETPHESAMMDEWRAQNSVDAVRKETFGSDEKFAERYAAEHDHEVFETEDEFLRRIYCQTQAA